MRLEIDKWGKITNENEDIEKVNLDNNLSNTHYETKIVKVNQRGGRRGGRGGRRGGRGGRSRYNR